MTATIAQQLDVLKGFDRWREAASTTSPDYSIEGYRKYLQARADRDAVEEIEAILQTEETSLSIVIESIQNVVWRQA